MKIRIMTIVLAIVALLLVLIPRISYSQPPVSSGVALPAPTTAPITTTPIANPSATDSPCFYRQADGTIVDLRSICGTGSTATPLPGGMVRSSPGGGGIARSAATNPAMNITPPNDPGVLYLSGSGSDPAAQAASQAEQTPTR